MVSESSLSRRICVFKLIPKRTFWIFQPIWSMQRTSTFHHLLLHVMTIIFWFYQGFGWTLSLLKCRVNTFHPDFLSSQLWLWRRPCVILLFFKKSQWQLRRYHCGWYQTVDGYNLNILVRGHNGLLTGPLNKTRQIAPFWCNLSRQIAPFVCNK